MSVPHTSRHRVFLGWHVGLSEVVQRTSAKFDDLTLKIIKGIILVLYIYSCFLQEEQIFYLQQICSK